MKCLNCGARIKKDTELCPECGAYISRDTRPSVPTYQNEEEINLEVLEKAEEAVRNIDSKECSIKIEEYDFRDYLLLPSLAKIGGGIVILLVVIFSFIESPLRNEATTVFALFFSLFALFSGIASIVQELNCKLTVNDEKVYGIIPKGILGTETIDISIGDIIGINETGFHSKNPNPKVHIVTSEKEFVVKGSSSIMLKDLSDNLQERVRKLKGESE